MAWNNKRSRWHYTTKGRALGLAGWIAAGVLAFVSSILFGATAIDWHEAFAAFVHYDQTSNAQVIIRTTRFPRAVMAAFVGGNLAVAGAIMQALTRNPLASPSIFGINAGAVFFVVMALTLLPISSMSQLVWVAFFGAGVAAATVYFLGSLGRDGLTPVKIVLAGAAITALFTSFTNGMLVVDEAGLQDVLFWLAGSVAGRSTDGLVAVLPYMFAAGLTALAIARPLNILVSGEDIARSLGQRTLLVKIAAGAVVVVLAGSSVAIAGSIGFVGLIVPHLARYLVGIDYRWVIPYSAVMGAVLLLLSDIAARFLIMPAEVPIGVMTALMGAPFFVYVARKAIRSKGVSS